MVEEKYVKVVGTGAYLPGSPIPFAEMENYLGEITNAPPEVMRWKKRIQPLIKEMVDIDYYHYAIDPVTKEPNEDYVTISVKAAQKALEAAHLKPQDVELITFGCPFSRQMPPTSTRIQEALGIESSAELAIHSNCTSAYKALLTAHDMVRTGRYKNALVIAAMLNSSVFRSTFFNQKVMGQEEMFLRWFLCDGAGALVLQAADTKEGGLFLEHTYMESIGGKKPSMMHNTLPAYEVNLVESFEKGHHHILQRFKNEISVHVKDENGYTVFTNGLGRMIQRCKLDLSKLRFFQINMPSKHVVELMLSECEEKLGIPKKTLYTNISQMGYTGPPAPFICLDKILHEEKLQDEDLILSFVLEVSKFIQAGFTMRYKA